MTPLYRTEDKWFPTDRTPHNIGLHISLTHGWDMYEATDSWVWRGILFSFDADFSPLRHDGMGFIEDWRVGIK